MQKKGIFIALMMMGVCFGSSANFRVQQASPAAYVDVEMPFRCVKGGADKQVTKTIALTPDDFSFTPAQSGDLLPRYAVNGYCFRQQPADQVLEYLLRQAGIKVVAPRTEYALLDGNNISGELSSVVEQIAEAGEVFYNYSAAKKRLLLLRRADYVLTVPQYKPVLMAVLDALRGSGIENLNVDWETYQIRLTVSPEELQKAKKLVKQILDDPYLLVADVQAYQVVPYMLEGSWQNVLNQSASILASAGRSVVGRSIVLKSRSDSNSFLQKVKSAFQLVPLVAGQAFVPNGWQMKFDMGECARDGALPYAGMSVVLKTKIQDGLRDRTQITLHTAAGVLSSFDVESNLNQEVILFGIPSKIGNAELLFTIKFGLVRFVQKGE